MLKPDALANRNFQASVTYSLHPLSQYLNAFEKKFSSL